MHQPSKKHKLDNKYFSHQSKLFLNIHDEKQYLQILSTLKNITNDNNNNYPTIPTSILQEIGEYSTGNIIKCNGKHELNKSECSGWIHFLYGDNFNDKICTGIDYWNCWNLCNYQCDDSKCNKTSNVLWCNNKDCETIKIIPDGDSPYPHYVCENAQKLKPTCSSIFCEKHFAINGVKCEFCEDYYCLNQCSKEHGKHCNKCDKYWCNQHVEDCNYCNVKCVFSSERHNINHFE